MGRNFNKDCPPCLTAFQGSGWRLPGGSLLGFTCLKPIVCLKHITCVHPLHVLIHHVCSSQVGNSQQDFLHFAAKSLQSCLTLCDPMDCSLPGSSVHGIFQARVLEWGAIAFSFTCHEAQRSGLRASCLELLAFPETRERWAPVKAFTVSFLFALCNGNDNRNRVNSQCLSLVNTFKVKSWQGQRGGKTVFE